MAEAKQGSKTSKEAESIIERRDRILPKAKQRKEHKKHMNR